MSDVEKEDCLRCQIGTLNGKRGNQLIAKCDEFGWRVLKLDAGEIRRGKKSAFGAEGRAET